MTNEDARNALNLSLDAGRDEIERAYRRSVREFGTTPASMSDAERKRFVRLEAAYQFLIEGTAATPAVKAGPARTSTPWGWILGIGAALLVIFLASQGGSQRTNAPTLADDQPETSTVDAITIESGIFIEWSYDPSSQPKRYRAGAITITIRGEPAGDDLFKPVVSIEAAGYPAYALAGDATSSYTTHAVAIGKLNAGSPIEDVVLQSFTGGAHCCNHVLVASADKATFRTIDLGSWDGGPQTRFPRDISGDGIADFVFSDDAFLYAFSGYAESVTPPQVMNVINATAVDVSDRKAFRPLFEKAMREASVRCVDPLSQGARNGACAAYIASAARLGQLDAAWSQMLISYERQSDWDLRPGCRVEPGADQCPSDQTIPLATFPEALRYLLEKRGYVPATAISKPPLAGEPGFACTKADSANLKLICATPALAAADSRMSVAYARALVASEEPKALRSQQAQFLSLREGFDWNEEGLLGLYEERISQLEFAAQ